MGRKILAVISGVVAGGILISIVQMIGHAVYPVPPGMDATDTEAIKAYIETAPLGALLFVILAWAVGAFGGGLLAAWIANSSQMLMALIVGGVLMISGIVTMVMIPHPTWFWILGLIVFLPAAYAGFRLAPAAKAA